tara:strand:+ start:544 stop:756 length:213 start_codon:yes stop_codon:yes gene_type:complete
VGITETKIKNKEAKYFDQIILDTDNGFVRISSILPELSSSLNNLITMAGINIIRNQGVIEKNRLKSINLL